MQKVLYFDFDRTLLNTDALKAEQAQRIARIAGISPLQVIEGMKSYIETLPSKNDFLPAEFASHLQNLYGISESAVLKIYATVPNYVTDFLYPDALPVLAELRARGFDLGIFSESRKEYQRLKMDRTGILEYMKPELVHILQRKTTEEAIAKLQENSFVVDDDLSVIDYLTEVKKKKVNGVWINRKSSEKHAKVGTIYSLSELLQLEL